MVRSRPGRQQLIQYCSVRYCTEQRCIIVRMWDHHHATKSQKRKQRPAGKAGRAAGLGKTMLNVRVFVFTAVLAVVMELHSVISNSVLQTDSRIHPDSFLRLQNLSFQTICFPNKTVLHCNSSVLVYNSRN